jgi:hypothetical protein
MGHCMVNRQTTHPRLTLTNLESTTAPPVTRGPIPLRRSFSAKSTIASWSVNYVARATVSGTVLPAVHVAVLAVCAGLLQVEACPVMDGGTD